MHVIRARNVHQALPLALDLLRGVGVPRPSRYGDVIVVPEPVTTVYERPYERVLFYPERDANPFFHFFESLWMLAGRNDVKFVAQFAKRMETFSDNGVTLHGAYGHRWRNAFGFDQLELVIQLLKNHPGSRRAMLQMWDCRVDLFTDENMKDLPCNTVAHFQIDNGSLNMTVFCRSNDLIWGAYGANAVHFSVLQEYVAGMLEVSVGRYWQVSDNFHAYTITLKPVEHLADLADPYKAEPRCPYWFDQVQPYPMVNNPRLWMADLYKFMENPDSEGGYENPFFYQVVRPLYFAHRLYKEKGPLLHAIRIAEECRASDWKKAAIEWLKRRQAKKEAQ